MKISDYKARRPAYSAFLIGGAGSGKTRTGCGFPAVYYIGTDPTGLDTAFFDPANAKLAANVVDGIILNGLPLDDVFANDEHSEMSIVGCIEAVKRLHADGKVRTIFLDNLTYLVDLKWQQLDGDNAKDKRQVFGQVATFASDLVLSRLLPLATRHGINVVIAMHVQRESKDAVEGVADVVISAAQSNAKKAEQLGQGKRHINLKSDLSPSILGSIRQKIGGMPSAMIWLNNEVTPTGLKYLAYCQKQYVPSWDAEIDAKNRYGLPPVLDLTNASLYGTLVARSREALAARQPTQETTAAPTTETAAVS